MKGSFGLAQQDTICRYCELTRVNCRDYINVGCKGRGKRGRALQITEIVARGPRDNFVRS